MKTTIRLLALLALAVFAPLALHAQTPPPTVSTAQTMIQCAPASGVVQSFWSSYTVIGGVTFSQPLVEYDWALTSSASVPVTVTLSNGTTAVVMTTVQNLNLATLSYSAWVQQNPTAPR